MRSQPYRRSIRPTGGQREWGFHEAWWGAGAGCAVRLRMRPLGTATARAGRMPAHPGRQRRGIELLREEAVLAEVHFAGSVGRYVGVDYLLCGALGLN